MPYRGFWQPACQDRSARRAKKNQGAGRAAQRADCGFGSYAAVHALRRATRPRGGSVTHRIIEIKARALDHHRARAVLRQRDARFVGLDHQVDTYFRAAHGRLKLREGAIENALIHYRREDQTGPKQSRVTLLQNPPGSTLKEILRDALGVDVVVDKQREIYFLDNVKVHLDEVRGLGTFVEIEAIDDDGSRSLEALRAQCEELMSALGIAEHDLLALSYSDLLR
jgi:predicted adenylyl cyclase CyaB